MPAASLKILTGCRLGHVWTLPVAVPLRRACRPEVRQAATIQKPDSAPHLCCCRCCELQPPCSGRLCQRRLCLRSSRRERAACCPHAHDLSAQIACLLLQQLLVCEEELAFVISGVLHPLRNAQGCHDRQGHSCEARISNSHLRRPPAGCQPVLHVVVAIMTVKNNSKKREPETLRSTICAGFLWRGQPILHVAVAVVAAPQPVPLLCHHRIGRVLQQVIQKPCSRTNRSMISYNSQSVQPVPLRHRRIRGMF